MIRNWSTTSQELKCVWVYWCVIMRFRSLYGFYWYHVTEKCLPHTWISSDWTGSLTRLFWWGAWFDNHQDKKQGSMNPFCGTMSSRTRVGCRNEKVDEVWTILHSLSYQTRRMKTLMWPLWFESNQWDWPVLFRCMSFLLRELDWHSTTSVSI